MKTIHIRPVMTEFKINGKREIVVGKMKIFRGDQLLIDIEVARDDHCTVDKWIIAERAERACEDQALVLRDLQAEPVEVLGIQCLEHDCSTTDEPW